MRKSYGPGFKKTVIELDKYPVPWEIRPLIASPAPTLFIYKAVTAWAIPKLKGARRKAPQSVSVDISLDAWAWRREATVNAAVAAGQAAEAFEERYWKPTVCW
ncbi:hypothetical protein ACQKO7_05855 [Pseudomonas putida]|uniref:hypothetical protein n=1 Tax=Pseudomonas putida TaxID=303 RepID=UPI003D087757